MSFIKSKKKFLVSVVSTIAVMRLPARESLPKGASVGKVMLRLPIFAPLFLCAS
jgi:hypothetical protein